MNLSQSTRPADSSTAALESLRDWWALAGVDTHYSDAPAALLGPQSQPVPPPKPNKPTEIAADKPEVPSAKTFESAPFDMPSDRFPDDYDAFIAWLSKADNLVESRWAKRWVLPQGALNPEIMVIAAMPEEDREALETGFSNSSTALLDRIWQAMGCDSANIYTSSACFARPVDGRIAPSLQDHLRKRMLHLVGLVQPQKIIVFGDQASELFFEQNVLSARKLKQFINHSSSKTEAIATFHPRILVQRPEFKSEAWKDLQLLMRNPAP